MEIKTEGYGIRYNASTQTLMLEGVLRLGELGEHVPIVQLLDDIVSQKPSRLTLDLRDLKFLSSSGFNILSRFVLKVRQAEQIELRIQASKTIPWHQRSLKNLQRLMPRLQLEFS
jgi:hypothetical protein